MSDPKDAPITDEQVQELLEMDLSKIGSPALARLIEEIRNDDPDTARMYDRVHNRHNRS